MSKKVFNILKHVILINIWVAFLIKLFVIDFDTYIVTKLLNVSPLLYAYKVWVFFLILLILSLSLKKWKFWLVLLYILFYPLIVIVWYIPKLLFVTKKFFGLIFFTDVVIHFVNKLRKILFLLFILTSAIIGINVMNDRWANISGMIILTGFLLYFGYSNLMTIFSPLRLFSIDIVKNINTLLEDKKPKKKKPSNDKKKNELPPEIKYPNRETAYLGNRILWFCSMLLDLVKERKLYVLYFFIKLSFIMFFATVIICEINYGFYKIDNSNFTIEQGSNLVPSLFAYTVNSYVWNDISFVSVDNNWPRYFRLFFQIYFAGLILSIAGFFYSVMSDRFVNAIDKTRLLIDKQYERNTRYIKAKFKVTPDELYDQLKSIRSIAINFVEKYLEQYFHKGKGKGKVKDKKGNRTPDSLR